jgi:hypothetical protein
MPERRVVLAEQASPWHRHGTAASLGAVACGQFANGTTGQFWEEPPIPTIIFEQVQQRFPTTR